MTPVEPEGIGSAYPWGQTMVVLGDHDDNYRPVKGLQLLGFIPKDERHVPRWQTIKVSGEGWFVNFYVDAAGYIGVALVMHNQHAIFRHR